MKRADAQRIWGREFLRDVELIDRILSELDLDPASHVLDVGTGWGIMAISLATHGFRVTTGEPDEGNAHSHGGATIGPGDPGSEGYGNWRRTAGALGVGDRIQFRPLIAEELPFPSESFQGVFLYDTLQHIQDREKALGESLRVLISEGVACVIETNDAGAKYLRNLEGFEIRPVDPRGYLGDARVHVDVVPGKLSDAFLIRRA